MNWPEAPYKRLDSYGPEDEPLFGGRSRDVSECLRLMQQPDTKLFVLHGMSGSGKSSLLRAGLIPALDRTTRKFQFVKDEAHCVIFVRSTADPLRRILSELRKFSQHAWTVDTPLGPEALHMETRLSGHDSISDESVVDDPWILVDALKDMARQVPATIVLIVDQGEEVITLKADSGGDKERSAFFEFLAVFTHAGLDCQILLAARTEYYGRIVSQFRRHEVNQLAVREYFLDELTPEQMKDVILLPTRGEAGLHYKFQFEPTVVDQMVNDLQSSIPTGGTLPVLQLVCSSLYERRGTDGIVRFQDYEKLGGLDGQLSYYLDQSLLTLARQQGLEPHQALNESAKWKSVFSVLVRTQADGTVTTDLVSSADLQSSAEALGCKIAFEVMAKHLCRPEIRILREASLTEGKQYYSLGHDTMGLAMQKARILIAQRAKVARQAELHMKSRSRVAALAIGVVGSCLTVWGPADMRGLGWAYIALSVLMLTVSFLRLTGANAGLVMVPDPRRAFFLVRILRFGASFPLARTYFRIADGLTGGTFLAVDEERTNAIRVLYPDLAEELEKWKRRQS